MIDVRDESRTHPKPFPLQAYRHLLVLAPHPDDEVYGCGGLLALARLADIEATALVLTDGSGGSPDPVLTEQRRLESSMAADLLGYRVEFGLFADRSLRLDAALTGFLTDACARIRPDLVLVPGLDDTHPDHQATALAAIQILAREPYEADLAFYETNGGLTHVSHILDISAVAGRKREAMQCFVSQEQMLPYANRIGARDCFRAFTLGRVASAAEAFFLAPLRSQGFVGLLPALDPLFRHGHHLAAAHAQDAPLVSVLIRSIGDPLIEQAVASVLAQTYRPLEIVVVAAYGRSVLADFPHLANCPLIRQVVPERPLNRPEAANAGIDAACGRYLLFLDDDDLLLPDHLEKLVAAIRARPEASAAYTGVVVRNPAGKTLRHYAYYDITPERLLATNLLPIHAVLFDRRLIDEGSCRFDEALPRFEDWDFWLQVSQHTGFIATAGISAIYRYRDRTGLFCAPAAGSEADSPEDLRQRILRKWRECLGDAPFDASLTWHARQLDHLEQRLEACERQAAERLEACERQAAERLEACERQAAERLEACERQAAERLEACERQAAELREQLESLTSSTIWRLTAPLRWMARRIIRALR